MPSLLIFLCKALSHFLQEEHLFFPLSCTEHLITGIPWVLEAPCTLVPPSILYFPKLYSHPKWNSTTIRIILFYVANSEFPIHSLSLGEGLSESSRRGSSTGSKRVGVVELDEGSFLLFLLHTNSWTLPFKLSLKNENDITVGSNDEGNMCTLF